MWSGEERKGTKSYFVNYPHNKYTGWGVKNCSICERKGTATSLPEEIDNTDSDIQIEDPLFIRKLRFTPLQSCPCAPAQNAYSLTYIVHPPILNMPLVRLTVYDFSFICSGRSNEVLCCKW